MATSAFKSTSRRATASERSPDKNAPIRRSHSVSALSRTHHRHHHLPQHDVASEFSNKRDNPLFWTSASPPDDKEVGSSAAAAETGSAERGRSVVRNSDLVGKKVVESGKKKDVPGRSLSRVDTGRRRRSVSRSHYAAYESEVERDSVVLLNSRSKVSSDVGANRGKKDNLVRNAADMRGRSTDRQPLKPKDTSASYLQVPNGEDGISAGSFLEAEEKTIKAVCEQMKGDQMGRGDTAANGIYETVRSEVRRAISDIQNDLGSVIQRNNATSIACTNVADIPPDLVNPGAVELVLDIRREYATKFEESQERATKLRADLAVEEHRGQELSRILKEILPDPKTNSVQKSRPRRKHSSERTKMSKRLTEEAMTFFDECVSISTFDSSDFSAPEDLPLNSVGTPTPVCGIASLAQGSPSISSTGCLDYKQESAGRVMHSQMDSSLTAGSSTDEPMINQASLSGGNNAELGRKSRFSFSRKPTENAGLRLDITNYIKNIEKEYENGGSNSETSKSNYYDGLFHGYTENLLFDRVLLKNQIDSGSLHLCGGGLAVSFSPLGSNR
ncbi:uncharacterized protein LOC131334819 isoform X2 [Rhododendron vialii]|uniref:uncharacterized protein LOC131334819 isoform X2 n=1 Tax=Rhododendron vialii TaxID=182163 RepID=UPI00265ECB0D|nr:uncharacterized protein LOC131334819 isoform X2 [Rhododendron vialii]